MSNDIRMKQLRDHAERGKVQLFDALWSDLGDAGADDVPGLVHAIGGWETFGNFGKAGELLSGLANKLVEQQKFEQALVPLRRMAEIAPKERFLRYGLLTVFNCLYKDDPRLPVYLRHSAIEEATDIKSALAKIETYFAFSVGRYVHHLTGWGAGRVEAIDAETVSVVIDFHEKKGHRLTMEMARKICDFIEPNELRAMRLDRMDALRTMAESDPVELIRVALRSKRGKAQLKDVKDRLTDGVIASAEWSKWWNKAKVKLKSVSDITLAPGTNPVVEMIAGTRNYPENCVRDMRLLDGDVKRVKYFRDLIKEAQAHESDGAVAVKSVADLLVAESRDMSLGARISLACLLRDAKVAYPAVEIPESLTLATVASDHKAVLGALPAIPVVAHRIEALRVLRESGARDWQDLYREVILRGEADTAEECLSDLMRSGKSEVVNGLVDHIVAKYREYPMAFTALAKAQIGDRLPEGVNRLPKTVLLEKVIYLHDSLYRRHLSTNDPETKRNMKVIETLMAAKEFGFVKDAIHASTEPEGMNLATVLRSNRSIPEDIQNKAFAGMLRARPSLGKITTEQASTTSRITLDPNVIYTTEVGLNRRQREYDHISNVELPEAAADKGRAAEQGDLSENFAYTAAIEKMGQLSRKAEDIAADLAKARVLSEPLADVDRVTIGARVTLSESDRRVVYTILGPWEADPEKGILSYLSPLGREMLGRSVGATFTVEGNSTQWKVEKIEDGLADFLNAGG